MHLSAPAGKSVNDGIPPDEFSLYYSSVDDAVTILLHLGRGALMAKVDFKAAFCMIQFTPQIGTSLECTGRDRTTWTPACHLACIRPHSYICI